MSEPTESPVPAPTVSTASSTKPDPGPTDPEMRIPWSPAGAAGAVAFIVIMVGGSIPFLMQSGDFAVILMSVLFIFFASAVAGAIVYTSTLDG